MHKANEGAKKARGNFVSVMVLVAFMLAGSYIATMDQTQNVSAALPIQRVPIEQANQPEPTPGAARATSEPTTPPATVGFAAYRQTLAGTRSAAVTLLDEVIADTSASAETVQQALQRKSELASVIAMETEMETLLKAKGFSDVLCTINPESVNIVVQSASLTQQQATQIMDIAMSVTGHPASHIRIIPSE